MLSVQANFDGQNVLFPPTLGVKKPQRVIVTFTEEPEPAAAEEPLAERFERLFENWYAETAAHSSGHVILGHPSFRQIIGLGKPAIPLILKKMQGKFSFIHFALEEITGEDPILEEHRGKPVSCAQDWLEWGKKNKYIR